MNALASASLRPVILLIDHDPLLITGMAAVLDREGYECHLARDPEAAVKAARALDLDLIVCDVNLNGYSGLSLVRELREEHGQRDVPVMFLSQQQLPDVIHRTFDATGAYYLRKPFEPQLLMELVAQALWMPHLVTSRLAPAENKPEVKPVSRVPAPLGMEGHPALSDSVRS
jgi:putative two-component system response regulator